MLTPRQNEVLDMLARNLVKHDWGRLKAFCLELFWFDLDARAWIDLEPDLSDIADPWNAPEFDPQHAEIARLNGELAAANLLIAKLRKEATVEPVPADEIPEAARRMIEGHTLSHKDAPEALTKEEWDAEVAECLKAIDAQALDRLRDGIGDDLILGKNLLPYGTEAKKFNDLTLPDGWERCGAECSTHMFYLDEYGTVLASHISGYCMTFTDPLMNQKIRYVLHGKRSEASE